MHEARSPVLKGGKVPEGSMLFSRSKCIYALFASTAALALYAPAAAQEMAPPPAHGAALEEVVVTARRRDERLQDVPVAVTALSGDQIAKRGVFRFSDLQQQTPSLIITTTTASPTAFSATLRGQSSSDIQLFIDQAVGLYTDGFAYPHPWGLNTGFVDVDRVEILKGPQGTLYGKSTTGGTINIISRGADFNGLHGFVQVEGGNYQYRRLGGALNVPIINDVLAMRAAYQRSLRDGYGRSRTTGQDLGGNLNDDFFRGSLLFTPTKRLRAEVKVEWAKLNNGGQMNTPRFYVPSTATNTAIAIEMGLNPAVPSNLATAQAFMQGLVAQGNSDFFSNDTNLVLFDRLTRTSVATTMQYELTDSIRAKWIAGYRELESFRMYDLDTTRFAIIDLSRPSPGPFFFPIEPTTKSRFYSQEANIGGEALGKRLTWLLGAYYDKEKGLDGTINNFRFYQTALSTPYTISFSTNKPKNTTYSFYSQNNVNLTSKFSVTIGARYTHDDKKVTFLNRRFAPSTGLYSCSTITLVTANPLDCAVTREVSAQAWSYLASANWKPTSDMLVYAKTSRGFRGGGLNVRSPTAPPFEPETATDYEAGLKADFLDHRLRLNIAGYTTRYANKQESISVLLGITPIFVIQNAATARIKGLELEATARPVEGLTLGATAGYLEGKYITFPAALTLDNRTVNANGEKFGNPDWTYSLSARYERAVGPGVAGVQADWSWTAGANPPARLVDPALPASLVNDLVGGAQFNYANGRRAIGLLNLRVDYELPDSSVRLAVFARNALNVRYQIASTSQLGTGGIQAAYTQEPRMWGVQIRKAWGE